MTGHDDRFIRMSTVRRDDQRVVMEEIRENQECPFCEENFLKYHKLPILHKGKFWILTNNQWPYENVKHQVLAVYRRHIEHLSEIDNGAGEELFQLFQDEAVKRGMAGGGVAMRFGSSPLGNYGSSVAHLHAHLIEPDLEKLAETASAWRFKFGQPNNYKSSKT